MNAIVTEKISLKNYVFEFLNNLIKIPQCLVDRFIEILNIHNFLKPAPVCSNMKTI